MYRTVKDEWTVFGEETDWQNEFKGRRNHLKMEMDTWRLIGTVFKYTLEEEEKPAAAPQRRRTPDWRELDAAAVQAHYDREPRLRVVQLVRLHVPGRFVCLCV
jgi:hypothetical protein